MPSNGGYPVVPPTDRVGALTPVLFRNLSTTRQKATFGGGCKWVSISYRLLPGATAVTSQFARVVINATSDSDANGKLATDGAFIALCQGDDIIVSAPSDELIQRVDVVTSVAVGAEVTLLQILGGV